MRFNLYNETRIKMVNDLEIMKMLNDRINVTDLYVKISHQTNGLLKHLTNLTNLTIFSQRSVTDPDIPELDLSMLTDLRSLRITGTFGFRVLFPRANDLEFLGLGCLYEYPIDFSLFPNLRVLSAETIDLIKGFVFTDNPKLKAVVMNCNLFIWEDGEEKRV